MKGFFDLKALFKKFVSICLAAAMISLVGCGKEKPVDKKTGKDSGNSSVPTSSNETENTESTADQIDPLLGEITYDTTKKTSKPRDDADEIRFTENPAGLSTNMTGKYEKEAAALRNKILNCGNTDTVYQLNGTRYYVSPGGNDENDGKSPETPFRTIDALGSVDFEKGDAVLFERGSIFRLVQPLSPVSGVTYGSYGSGEKPKFYASPMNFAQMEWKPSNRKNIWKTTYVYDAACSMVFNNGKEIGYLKTSIRNLKANTHFYQDEAASVLYLYCDKGNPSKVYESIEVCPKMDVINIASFAHDVTIDNLCLRYSGSFGVDAVYNNNNITVSNCEIGFMGGMNNGTVRYGNAIQAWTNASNFKVIGNYIYQTFDTAVTWQGQDRNFGKDILYKDIVFTGNLLEYNNGDFEFWHSGGTVDNFTIADNICRFTSLGWGTRVNDAGFRGIEGFIFANTQDMIYKNTITVRNNIIDCPGCQIISWKIFPENLPFINVSGNKFFVKQSYRTSTEALRGYRTTEEDAEMVGFQNLEELKTALIRFDKTALIELAE